MSDLNYCIWCEKNSKHIEKTISSCGMYRGIDYKLKRKEITCSNCGEWQYHKELEYENYVKKFNIYKKKMQLDFEIQEIPYMCKLHNNRFLKNITQEQLDEELDLPIGTIFNIENYIEIPNIKIAFKIANYFRKQIEEIFVDF